MAVRPGNRFRPNPKEAGAVEALPFLPMERPLYGPRRAWLPAYHATLAPLGSPVWAQASTVKSFPTAQIRSGFTPLTVDEARFTIATMGE